MTIASARPSQGVEIAWPRPVDMRLFAGIVQYRVRGTATWINIFNLADLQGVNEAIVLGALQAHGFTVDANGNLHLTDAEGRITTLSAALTAEANARGAADDGLSGRITTLSAALTAEANARGAADNELAGRITDEATARGDAITREAGDRNTADGRLSDRIDAEVQARAIADTALSTRIDAQTNVRGIPGTVYRVAITDLKGYAVSVEYLRGSPVLPGAVYASVITDARGYARDITRRVEQVPGPVYAEVVTDERGYARSVDRVDGADPRPLPRFDTGLLHIIGDGQSLSRGVNGGIPVTTTAPARTYRFNGGDRADDGGGTSAQNHASLVPFVATVNSKGEGETPNGGTAISLAQLMAAAGMDLAARGQSILMSAPGQSGQAIAALSSGGPYWQRMLDDITYGYAAAAALGLTYSLPFMTWTQGETDILQGTTRDQYKALLRQLRTDVHRHLETTVPRSERLVCITYQVGTHDYYGRPPDIALAQLDLGTEDDSDFVCACPMYLAAYTGDVHPDAASLKRIGGYYGKAADYLRRGDLFRPVYPLFAERQRNVVALKFHVPVAPLVLDTSEVTDPNGAFGFEIYDPAANANIPITAVRVVAGRTVELVGNRTIPPNARARYAYTPPAGFVPYGSSGTPGYTPLYKNIGARGCLRDSDPYVFEPSGLNVRLYNYCVIFDREII
ncbi:hypothetical protein [Methylobacterium sp. JK268]